MDVSSPNTTSSKTAANRRVLLLTALVFILPVIIAYVLLKTGWYSSAGTSNKGILIDPPISFDDLQLTNLDGKPAAAEQFRKKWWILYIIPSQCEAACRNSLYLMRQTHQALGPDQPRVAEMVITTQGVSDEVKALLDKEFSSATRLTADAANVNQVLGSALNGEPASNAGHLFLVDTMGAVFMHYPAYADEQESILKGRNLLNDLKKVLKISKIG